MELCLIMMLQGCMSCGAGIYMAVINTDFSISPCDLLCDEIKSNMKISQECGIKDIWNNDTVLKDWRKLSSNGCMAYVMKNNGEEDPCMEVYKSGRSEFE